VYVGLTSGDPKKQYWSLNKEPCIYLNIITTRYYMTTIYDMGIFEDILERGFDYKLPTSVVDTLTTLHCKSSNTKSPYKQLTFKKIIFSKHIPALDKSSMDPYTEMRLMLNKISNKTYLLNVDRIVEIYNNIPEEEISDFEHKMLEIFINNRFYVKLYADIFALCLQNRPSFMCSFDKYYEIFLEAFNNITYVDPVDNYDLFCKNNLINERQKTFTSFIKYLTLSSVISSRYINNLIQVLSMYIETHLCSSDHTCIIDEMIENITLCYSKPILCNQNIDFIAKLVSYKPKQYPGLSSRSIFKLMDVV